ncbi:sigma-70 family RNA polymerase sigma factor [Acutalibacter caecimuris]|uniref:sigma-70 family RNA polymerase sigma factor n=1 Tax=Acutalibacter caecimuris TaxID=3093657 RepID=UPI002AC9C92C|nr:sigma-70 family RNA polymerase sigma factor [Acutalibacter sp. M00118]
MAEDYRACSDQALTEKIQAGAPEAFVELSARYLQLVRAKAGRFTGPGMPEWEDLAQEGFLGLYTAALTFDATAGASFATYAGVCVFNRMASAARRHRSLGNRPLNESLPLDSAGDLPQSIEGPEGLYELRESYDRMWRRIEAALTPLELQALRLYLQGCGREEIEGQAGIPIRRFHNALHRVRLKLRRL